MKIHALSLAFVACFWPSLVLAQETPRDKVIDEILQVKAAPEEPIADLTLVTPSLSTPIPPEVPSQPVLEVIEELLVEDTEEVVVSEGLLPLVQKEDEPEGVLVEELVTGEIAVFIPEEKVSPVDEQELSLEVEMEESETTLEKEEVSETIVAVVEEPDTENSEIITKSTPDITVKIPAALLPKKTPTLPRIAAFYLTTEEYLNLRAENKMPQLVLTYEVSTQKKGMILPVTSKVELIVGRDFAAVKTGPIRGVEIRKIYDFKFNRLLTVSTQSGPNGMSAHFDNISLYAPVYRNIRTVRGATQNGSLKMITLGGGKKLDAFWVESAMSWAVDPQGTNLSVREKASGFKVEKGRKTIFNASFSEETYPEKNFKQSLLSLAYHEWPLHPQVLEIFAQYDAPPKAFTMLSYSPSALDGETQTWTLVDRKNKISTFPLPATALGISQRKPISSLVFIIGEAVKGQAFGGPQTPEELEFDYKKSVENGDDYALWLIGQRYNSYTGKCDQDSEVWLCKELNSFEKQYGVGENKAEVNTELEAFIQAVRLSKTGANYAEVLTLLQPYLNDPDVPAIILQTAAMARAKMKSFDILNSEFAAISPEKLLQSSLVKDPYDPNTYLGLAQINAANEAYEASWDFYDVLRTGTGNAGAVDLKIDKVEAKLRADAPGYFAGPK